MLDNILAVIREALAGDIVNNRLNPVRLAIATSGYDIQSRILHIPDRIGFFSPGPPRLQVFEAGDFIFTVLVSCSVFVSTSATLCLIRYSGGNTAGFVKGGAGILLLTVMQALVMWLKVCCSPRRAPGYDWGDWKLRKD